MRTTLNLDDDILETARALAASERRSLGAVVSELARRGLTPWDDRRGLTPWDDQHRLEDEFPTFLVGPHASVITNEMVEAALSCHADDPSLVEPVHNRDG